MVSVTGVAVTFAVVSVLVTMVLLTDPYDASVPS
jgi:hypothetical protein